MTRYTRSRPQMAAPRPLRIRRPVHSLCGTTNHVDAAGSIRSERGNRINAGRTPRGEVSGHPGHAEEDGANCYERDGVRRAHLVEERLQ